jgi:tetratricopeptide (TPR) repeat protein
MRADGPILVLAYVLVANAQSSRLPELPQVDTSKFLPAIREQIERAESDAGAHAEDARFIGVLAMTLHAYQQYDAAERVYERAHQLEPREFNWLYLRGAVEMELGQFDAAAKSFSAALEILPDDLAARLRLAQSWIAIAGWDRADEQCRRILEKHGDCAQAWYSLGRTQAARGDHAGAAKSYAKACDLFPEYGAAHFALAAELRRLGKPAEAEQQTAAYAKNVTAEPPLDDPLFRRIHELNHSGQAHVQRGTELEKAGQLADAIREHEAALETDPANVQVHINLIALYGRTGDAAKARQHFETAIQLSPGRSDAWYDYGVLLFHEHNNAEAERAFERAIEINPSYAEAHNNLGAAYELDGKLDEAAREFRAAIASQPNFPLARFHLGRILVNQQKYDEAIQQFERALEPEDDKTPTYLYALGATYARAGDREHALAYMRKARDGAAARGQSQLLASIDRDLKALGGAE